MTYAEIGKPAIKWIMPDGWAIFKGGARAWLSHWDEYQQGFTTDFPVYCPPVRADYLRMLTLRLEHPDSKSVPVLPQPDARSLELGDQNLAQCLGGYRAPEHEEPMNKPASTRRHDPYYADLEARNAIARELA
jgi:hypothetical protein